MKQETNGRGVRARISKYYTIAVYCYLLPPGFLGLYFLDFSTIGLTGAFFLATTVLSLLPVGVVGLLCTVKGLKLAFKSGDHEKKDIGYANLIMGLILAVGGLISLGLTYVMTS